MATIPMCKYCKTRHWLREPHNYGDTKQAKRTSEAAPAKLTFGVTSAKPILPDEFGSPDVWQALADLEARVSELERNASNALPVTAGYALPTLPMLPAVGNTLPTSMVTVTDELVTVTPTTVTRNAAKQRAYRERQKAHVT